MRIAITANGPGEVAGWVRPLLRRLYAREPNVEVHVFLVPDDYASGGESAMLQRFFPQAHIHEPREYLAFALGRKIAGIPESVDIVQYIGGDLMHAARLHRRLGGKATTYKFSKPGYRAMFVQAFAVDAKNAGQLRNWQIPPDRIAIIGNLAIDGALIEAELPLEENAPRDGVLMMPGSRAYEVENMIPFCLTVARRMHRERPDVPVGIAISPFTSIDSVRTAVERGGDPRMWSERGRLVEESSSRVFLESLDGSVRVPVLRNAMAAARAARLVLTIPGTKAIELAALGVPIVSITPINIAEKVPVNGPLTYLDRLPFAGGPLKRFAVLKYSKRFTFHTQPNMDMNEMVIHEIHGMLTPGRVARAVLERYDDPAWLQTTRERLRALYAAHIGAADRMAAELLALAAAPQHASPTKQETRVETLR